MQPLPAAVPAARPWSPARGPRAFALCALIAALAGCATLPGEPAPPPVAAVVGDPSFELTGRLAIRQGDQAVSANLRWRFDGTGEEMVIAGPLGAGSVEIGRDASGVTLRAQGRVERAADAETLMRNALGFALPLDGLRYWVRGQPAPGERAVRIHRDALGRLDSFHDSGWQVSIPAYSAAPLQALPRRVDVESGALQVRLVIDEWLTPPTGAARAGAADAAAGVR